MGETLVTKELSLRLKELGFDWSTLYFYDKEGKVFSNGINNYNSYRKYSSAPTLSHVIKWLLHTKNILVSTYPTPYEEYVNFHVEALYLDSYFKSSGIELISMECPLENIDETISQIIGQVLYD